MKSFEIKTKIHFGDNALERLAQMPYKRVLVITDPFIAKGSMINMITEPLKKSGKAYEVFHDVVPDAPIDKIIIGVKKMLEYMPDAVVAVGGGSAIDSSKSIYHLCNKRIYCRNRCNIQRNSLNNASGFR